MSSTSEGTMCLIAPFREKKLYIFYMVFLKSTLTSYTATTKNLKSSLISERKKTDKKGSLCIRVAICTFYSCFRHRTPTPLPTYVRIRGAPFYKFALGSYIHRKVRKKQCIPHLKVHCTPASSDFVWC